MADGVSFILDEMGITSIARGGRVKWAGSFFFFFFWDWSRAHSNVGYSTKPINHMKNRKRQTF